MVKDKMAAVYFIPVFLEYLNTGLVLEFPTFIVCGFVVIAAFLSFFTGMILQTIIQKDRQEFEFRLQLTNDRYQEKTSRIYDNEKMSEQGIK